MNLRQLAEVLLVVRENSRRIGASFELYEERLASIGVDPKDLPLVTGVVMEIERHREHQLSLLDKRT